MAKFRKKPVIVEATQWTGRGCVVPGVRESCVDDPQTVGGCAHLFYVVTAHGEQAYLEPGDWVITEPDARGHYPCKPDIFAATYEAA